MARLTPAAWSLWAMAQAMLRLLARPKTTAVRPSRLSMFYSLDLFYASSETQVSTSRPSASASVSTRTIRISASEVDQLHFGNGLAEETGTEFAKLGNGVGCIEPDRGRTAWRRCEGVESKHYFASGRFGGIDDCRGTAGPEFADCALDDLAKERVVG